MTQRMELQKRKHGWLPLERLITLIYINEVKIDAKKKILFFIYFDIINLTKLLENING